MKTEKQKDFEEKFIEIVKSAGKLLSVEFVSNEEATSSLRRGESRYTTSKSFFGAHSAAVNLTLIEGDDITVWMNALLGAKEDVEKLRQQNEWLATNPNFFTAISMKYYQIR